MSQSNYERCVWALHRLGVYLERMTVIDLLPGEVEPEGELARKLEALVDEARARTKKGGGEG